MDKSRVHVDFNEMPSPNEVLLSQFDSKADANGTLVTFTEGQAVGVYCDDVDDHGRPCHLVADGIVTRNRHGGWASRARWLLRIDARGIRHESGSHDH